MRIGEILYFSPRYRFVDLSWNNREQLVNAFQDRVQHFYLEAIDTLNQCRRAFAAGLICVSTIDFLARIEFGMNAVPDRIEKWLTKNITPFGEPDPQRPSRTLARRFNDEFRNGLVHEGRIKNAGQFCYDYDDIFRTETPVIIVNPLSLGQALSLAFTRYVRLVREDEFSFQGLRCALIRDFQEDFEIARG